MWRAASAWQREIRKSLAPHDLTHGQFVVLAVTWWLTQDGAGPPTQRQVTEHAGTDAMTTSQVVRRLISADRLERRRDGDDGRAWRLLLTPAGTQRLVSALPAVEAVDAAFFGPLGKREAAWRAALLELAPSS